MDLLLNLGLAALATYLTCTMLRFVRVAARARGELVAYASEHDGEGDLLHRPVYSFADRRGQIITASNPRQAWLHRRLAIGQLCNLRYNPANPSQIYRDSWVDLWLLPVALWAALALRLLHLLLG
jgi:hypothetical protein